MKNLRPIIGIAGGIGAGKTFVARMFSELGCLLLSADDAVTQAYAEPVVQQTLRHWWGEAAFEKDGSINRRWIAGEIFSKPVERQRLEAMLHRRVEALRTEKMNHFANDPSVVAFIWDVPLLFETGQDGQCDAIIFVDSPAYLRSARVRKTRDWREGEWSQRENLQLPLDKKREMSDYIVVNAADAAETRRQVRDVLSQILQVSKAK